MFLIFNNIEMIYLWYHDSIVIQLLIKPLNREIVTFQIQWLVTFPIQLSS